MFCLVFRSCAFPKPFRSLPLSKKVTRRAVQTVMSFVDPPILKSYPQLLERRPVSKTPRRRMETSTGVGPWLAGSFLSTGPDFQTLGIEYGAPL
jgi:hypothetical protein